MSDQTIDRLGVMCGLFCVLLGIVAVGLGTGTAAANPGASPEEIARAYATAPTPLGWSGAYLEVLAYLLLFVFIARLWAVLRTAQEPGPAWLATAAVFAGLLSVGLTLAGFAVGSSLRYRSGAGLHVEAALALFDVHVALYVASWALAAVFLGTAAAIILNYRVLPRWLGWAAGAIALLDLAAVGLPTSPLASFPNLLLLLWVLAASVILLRRASLSPTAGPARAASSI
jgi:hypothetical protein